MKIYKLKLKSNKLKYKQLDFLIKTQIEIEKGIFRDKSSIYFRNPGISK